MRATFTLAILYVLTSGIATGQMIDNTSMMRDIKSPKSVRLHYENDYFSASDQYYTQGINLEIYHPVIATIFPSPLRKNTRLHKYGIAFEHLGFTPTSISSSAVLDGDRPFASCLMAKMLTVPQHPLKRNRIASALSLGVIGPMAGGKEFQSAIHRWINDDQPLGWQHQIRNDLVLNVDIVLDQSLFTAEHFMIAAKGICRAGTLNTKVEFGSTLMAGWYDNPWSIAPYGQKKFRVYLYANPSVAVIGYDATLQGGLFNKHSPYTISAGDISRIVFQNNAAIVFKIKNLYVEYFQSFITKEFSTGTTHRWGGVRLGLAL